MWRVPYAPWKKEQNKDQERVGTEQGALNRRIHAIWLVCCLIWVVSSTISRIDWEPSLVYPGVTTFPTTVCVPPPHAPLIINTNISVPTKKRFKFESI
jgi:hypothetical protein